MSSALRPDRFAEQTLGLEPGAFPFESRTFLHRCSAVHYVDEGPRSAPVLFMVHGNPTWSFLYRKLVAGLRPTFRCIALDLPGFGLSLAPEDFEYTPEAYRDTVVALLAHLDVRDGTLIAHDWGGPIGLSSAQLLPGSLTRFVLGNTWAWPVNGTLHFEWFSRVMGGPLGRWGARHFNFFVNSFIPLSMRRGALPPEVIAAYRAPVRWSGNARGSHEFPKHILHSRPFLTTLAQGLATLDERQFLFLWPDRDIAFRARELARWRTMFPRSTVVPIANCGHFPWEEAAEEAVGAITAWHRARPANAGSPRVETR
ncbi:MAG: alpha/beta fold hydrolase [Burkholderiales bacterium]|nr:alpha/beta fold hydrolase [Burkholderiales bacterium]